jgi:drug/metabolite transporter (DMT)-like permease
MFLGEFLCLLAFRALLLQAARTGRPMETAKPFSRLIFVLPAVCDMTGTSLMYVGLTLTDASIFQMLRGSVIVFTGILSVVFLKRKLGWHHWLGIACVIAGTAIVGTASLVCGTTASTGCPNDPTGSASNNATLGNILIIIAQLVVAIQVVVEEKFIGGYNIPALQVVGWEGVFGFTILSTVVGIMYTFPAPAQFCTAPVVNGTTITAACSHFEDAQDAFVEIGNSWRVALALAGNILSIAFFK